MSCCPLSVIKACKCLQPPPVRHLPIVPPNYTPLIPGAPFTATPPPWSFYPQQYPVFQHQQCPVSPHFVYGGYLSRPWETLFGRHPFQGDFKQLIYCSGPPVRWWEMLWLYWLWSLVYLVLPLLLVLANYSVIVYEGSRLSLLLTALLYNVYYEFLSAHFRNVYHNFLQKLQRRSQAQLTLSQLVQSYRTSHYNELTLKIQ